MGFGIGILIIGANLYGGVYKLRILIREKLEEIAVRLNTVPKDFDAKATKYLTDSRVSLLDKKYKVLNI